MPNSSELLRRGGKDNYIRGILSLLFALPSSSSKDGRIKLVHMLMQSFVLAGALKKDFFYIFVNSARGGRRGKCEI